MAVGGETRIQTRGGCPKISDLVDTVTKENQKLYRVTLSDGSYVDCTGDHVWDVKRSGCLPLSKKRETLSLKRGDIIKEPEAVTFDGVTNFDVSEFTDDVYLLNRSSLVMYLLKEEMKHHTEEKARGLQILFRRIGEHVGIEEKGQFWIIRRNPGPQRVVHVIKLEGTHTVYTSGDS